MIIYYDTAAGDTAAGVLNSTGILSTVVYKTRIYSSTRGVQQNATRADGLATSANNSIILQVQQCWSTDCCVQVCRPAHTHSSVTSRDAGTFISGMMGESLPLQNASRRRESSTLLLLTAVYDHDSSCDR